jgi:catechol 2,3-dioxygenase-like lactoylglutathione lyase family enzyme
MKLALVRLLFLVATASLFVVHAQTPAGKEIKRPAIVGVAHIRLRTDNVDAARAFYRGMLGFDETWVKGSDNNLLFTNFKVNDHQFIQVFPGLKSPTEDRLVDIAFETTDAQQLRAYLGSKGVEMADTLEPVKAKSLVSADSDIIGDFIRGISPDVALSFTVRDPDGHLVEFVQYLPRSMYAKDFGKHLGARRISERIIHVGVTVKDREAADHFYRDILGFKLQWHGGMKDEVTDWVAMRVPQGTDWLEYMLNVHDPSPRTLGVMHHFSLGVPSVKNSYQEILKRGMKDVEPPKVGRDGKWQLNLYDPDGTRAELMEPTPVEKPCCSPILP